jgi:pyruvate,water dikinase
MLQNHLRGQNGSGPGSGSKTQEAMRQRAAQTLRRQLRWNPRRPFFEILLRWTRRYSVDRENLKQTFVMIHGYLRRLYLALADHLVERGALAEADDLFYLTRPEIHALLAGPQNRETINETIDRRRADYLHHQDVRAPKIIEQWPDGSLRLLARPHHQGAPGTVEGAEETEKEAFTLHGVAASAGRITGFARVILDPLEAGHLQPGEILVAPSTNPAWAPLLLNAGGLITEVGGLLSHGAIVAREYGLPAVLNVRNATRTIRTGQRIAVDGCSGTVRLLDGA